MQELTVKKMTAGQRGCIYATAGELGMVERGNPDDDLHGLVYRVTSKHSLSMLSSDEANLVIDELARLMKLAAIKKQPQAAPSSKHEQRPGGITADQQRKVWRLMYLLRDASPSSATLGDRLCGIIHKSLKVDCTTEQPFRFVTMEGGWKLIESLKKILKNADKGGI